MKSTLRNLMLIAAFAAGLAMPASALADRTKSLFAFGGANGSGPLAAMIADREGNLYGTTNLGGTGPCASGCGTVFELSPPAGHGGNWSETVIHSFQGGSDGANPQANLIADGDGNIYGATSAGGNGKCSNGVTAGCGTIFELARTGGRGGAWNETVLYSFQGVPSGRGNGDAAWPNGLIFDTTGNLYGMAYSGGHCSTDETGTSCWGAAFELKKQLDSGWSEKVIYRFRGPSGAPASAIFDTSGNLYGTAPGGAFGCGGIFELKPPTQHGGAWAETSVYDFHGGADGAFPLPGLIFDATGNLYGASMGTASEYGNVFELSPSQSGSWSELVLYNFTPVANGYVPTAGPILGSNGHLYGTTIEGGQSDRGTVFELAPPDIQNGPWSETVLHSFGGGSDGFAPDGGLTFGKGGALYGTTVAGGDTACANGNGCGTIFRTTP